jgi:hypothetical protein
VGDLRIPSEDVRNKIASLSVDCTDGRRSKLKDTILPTLRSAVCDNPAHGIPLS